jgi:DNA polymerase-4
MSTRWLFLDMNAFFASVEQQEDPSLRGRPVIVAPVMADNTVAIAASYEAKKYGIKTGTRVGEAKRLCPHLLIVEGHHDKYREYHNKIVDVIHSLFATVKVLSVDEMACRLSPLQRETEEQLALRVKAELHDRAGDWLTCSIGVAPNIFLAKVASETMKPDGLTIWREEDLPHATFCLGLRDLPGIGPSMHARLESRGIRTVEQLYQASSDDLWRVTGSIVGKRWHHMLRGSQEADYGTVEPEERKTVGHSHVLPPSMRSPEGAERVLLRLLSKALKRLRAYDQAAGAVFLTVKYACRDERGYRKYAWKGHSSGHQPIDDDVSWMHVVRGIVGGMPPPKSGFEPVQVGIHFSDLVLRPNLTPCLFGLADRLHSLSKTVDDLNARFGYKVDLASVYWLKNRAPDRISFGTSLLNTGELVTSTAPTRKKATPVEPAWEDYPEGVDIETDVT